MATLRFLVSSVLGGSVFSTNKDQIAKLKCLSNMSESVCQHLEHGGPVKSSW